MADYALVALLFVQMLATSVYSVIAPFLPPEAEEKGISSSMIGLIFSGYPIAASISSPIFGKYCSKIGRKKLLFVGCFLEASSTLGFSSVVFLDKNWFVVVGLLNRLVQGLGAGAMGTATYAIVSCTYPDRMESVLGLVNTLSALGMMLGPLAGSGLYALGGLVLLFVTYGLFFMACMPLLALMIPKDKPYVKKELNISAKEVFKVRGIWMDGLVVILAISSLSFLNPTLSNHLSGYKVDPSISGILFTVPTFSYALMILMMNYMNISRKILMMVGLGITALADLTIGPWGYMGLPHELWVSILGLVIFGLGLCLCILPALPDMVSEGEAHLTMYDSEQVSDFLSGILNSETFIGEMVGPPLAGVLTDYIGFENAEAVIAFSLIGYLLVFGVFSGALFGRKATKGEQLLVENEMVATDTKKEEVLL